MAQKRNAQYCIGKIFVRLTVQSVDWISTDNKIVAWADCLCSCGSSVRVRVSNLKNGTTKSCGCLRIETCSSRVQAMIMANASKGIIREPRLGSAARVYNSYYKDGNLSLEEFVDLSQKDCFYCGARPSNCSNAYKNQKFYSPTRIKNGDFIYNGLDRVDNNQPHNKDNVVPCCWDCNAAKLKRSKEEFLLWIRKIYKLHFIPI